MYLIVDIIMKNKSSEGGTSLSSCSNTSKYSRSKYKRCMLKSHHISQIQPTSISSATSIDFPSLQGYQRRHQIISWVSLITNGILKLKCIRIGPLCSHTSKYSRSKYKVYSQRNNLWYPLKIAVKILDFSLLLPIQLSLFQLCNSKSCHS